MEATAKNYNSFYSSTLIIPTLSGGLERGNTQVFTTKKYVTNFLVLGKQVKKATQDHYGKENHGPLSLVNIDADADILNKILAK